mgnify:CR=1 FL=1
MNEPGRSALADQTDVGSYFVATYPPVLGVDARGGRASTRGRRWRSRPDPARAARPLPAHPVLPEALPLLLLPRLHRQERAGGRRSYLDVLAREWELYAEQPAIAGRPLNFVYFGGGTPSFLSTQQLESLVVALSAIGAVEPAPKKSRSSASRARSPKPSWRRSARFGVTRLSLGVENFDDRILELNGRAHRSPEIAQAYRARAVARLSADQHRPDRRHARRDRGELARLRREDASSSMPDSVTIYQMELPFNTTISQDLLEGHEACSASRSRTGRPSAAGCAEAFEALERAGYTRAQRLHRGEGSVADRNSSTRDRLWQGADMVGLGVASFGHVNGVHMQNQDTWETYSEAVGRGEIPLEPRLPADDGRAADSRARAAAQTREHPPVVFRGRTYGADILQRFQAEFASLQAAMATCARPTTNVVSDARGPAARRHPASAILPARTRGNSHIVVPAREFILQSPRPVLRNRTLPASSISAGSSATWRKPSTRSGAQAGLSIHPPEQRVRLAACRRLLRLPARAALRGRDRRPPAHRRDVAQDHPLRVHRQKGRSARCRGHDDHRLRPQDADDARRRDPGRNRQTSIGTESCLMLL